MEYTAGGMFYARAVATRGYRPFNRSLDDIERMRRTLTNDDEVLVFKVKANINKSLHLRVAGPIGDLLDLSWYHEALIGVSRDTLYVTEYGSTGGKFYLHTGVSARGLSSARGISEDINDRWGAGVKKKNFQYVGKADRIQFFDASRSNPLGVVSLGGLLESDSPNGYHWLTRNCQSHVTATLREVNLVQ
jgi:hypothetical protein